MFAVSGVWLRLRLCLGREWFGRSVGLLRRVITECTSLSKSTFHRSLAMKATMGGRGFRVAS
jgi:hypothetical protein